MTINYPLINLWVINGLFMIIRVQKKLMGN